MKLTLAYLCNTKSWGGLEMNQIRNATWMKERGHDVHVFVLIDSPAYTEALENNLTVHIISKHKKHYDFYNAYKLFKILTKINVNCLIVRSTFDMSIAASVSFFSGRKIKTVFCMEMQLSFPKKQFFRTWRYRYLDAWCCPLNYLKEQVLTNTNMNKDRIFVVPSGIDIQKINLIPKSEAREELNLPQCALVFGVLGRIDPKKGHKTIIETWKNTSDSILLIQGDSESTKHKQYLKEIYAFITQNKLNNRIHFKPFSSNTQFFFNAIDALIVPSENETVGMVTIEAIAYKKTVIGSNSGGTREILSNPQLGYLFEPNSHKDLIKKIKEFEKDKNNFFPQIFSTEIGKYNKDRVCEKMEEIIVYIIHKKQT
jgi:glycosyltransferase involved in cell wall biosynthesis